MVAILLLGCVRFVNWNGKQRYKEESSLKEVYVQRKPIH